MKREQFSILTALLLASTMAAGACTSAPPEQGPGDGDGDGTTGDGDGTTGDGDGTTGDGDGTTGDGDGTIGDGDGDVTGTPVMGEPPYGNHVSLEGVPTYPGFTLWVYEDFENPIDLDNDPIWTYSDGGLPEGQVRFVKEGIKFENGNMILQAEPDDGTYFSDPVCSHAEVDGVDQKALTSGELRTRHNLFRYGRYETRMKAPTPNGTDPAVNGNYIATLFTFRTPKFETWREIDIEVTGNAANAVTTNVINGNEQFVWNASFADANEAIVDGANTRTEFHDFAFEWLPTGITWYVDGEVIREYTTSEKLPIPELSAKIMMNLWIFNNSVGFGGTDIENNNYENFRSEYEWFRFYKWDQETTYPCKAMNESCLAEDDKNLSSNNPCDGISAAGVVKKMSGDVASCTTTCPY